MKKINITEKRKNSQLRINSTHDKNSVVKKQKSFFGGNDN